MKVRPDLKASTTVEVSDALVFVDEYHRRLMGLNFLGDHCVLAEPQDPVDGRHVAVVTSVAEQVVSRAAFAGSASALTLVLPREQLHMVESFLSLPQLAHHSVCALATDGRLLLISFAERLDTDLPVGPLLAGLRVADSFVQIDPDHRGRAAADAEIRARLISALELLKTTVGLDAGASGTPPADATGMRQLAELEGRLVRLTRERDALQRKYDSLAGSRLGRLTLRRWDQKRGLNS